MTIPQLSSPWVSSMSFLSTENRKKKRLEKGMEMKKKGGGGEVADGKLSEIESDAVLDAAGSQMRYQLPPGFESVSSFCLCPICEV